MIHCGRGICTSSPTFAPHLWKDITTCGEKEIPSGVIYNFVLEWVLHYIVKATDSDLCGVPKMYQERKKETDGMPSRYDRLFY